MTLRPFKLIDWSRQRRIAYPWHVCHARNDNWLPWGADLRRPKKR